MPHPGECSSNTLLRGAGCQICSDELHSDRKLGCHTQVNAAATPLPQYVPGTPGCVATIFTTDAAAYPAMSTHI